VSTTLKIVIALFLAVVFRLAGGLLGEIVAVICFLVAASIGALAWRRTHPRPEEQLDDEQAYRIEEEKLARYSRSSEA
jgi:hypothetical protein